MSDRRGGVETDPSVCYRHPGRQSWVLCQRCGKTVCPECQILAPVGVHCPDCVAETAGGVTWRAAGGATVTPLKPKRRRSSARVRTLLMPRGVAGNASSVMLGVAVLLFVVGSFTALPAELLAVGAGEPWQVWRYVTGPFVWSAGTFSIIDAVFFALSAVFFWLTAPQVERMIGTTQFLLVAAAAAIVGDTALVLAGGAGIGLTPITFGCFAALLVLVWDDRQARVQILVMIGINLLLSISISRGAGLSMLVGGMLGGGGVLWLTRTGPDRGWRPRTPYLITGGVCAVLIVLASLV